MTYFLHSRFQTQQMSWHPQCFTILGIDCTDFPFNVYFFFLIISGLCPEKKFKTRWSLLFQCIWGYFPYYIFLWTIFLIIFSYEYSKIAIMLYIQFCILFFLYLALCTKDFSSKVASRKTEPELVISHSVFVHYNHSWMEH